MVILRGAKFQETRNPALAVASILKHSHIYNTGYTDGTYMFSAMLIAAINLLQSCHTIKSREHSTK